MLPIRSILNLVTTSQISLRAARPLCLSAILWKDKPGKPSRLGDKHDSELKAAAVKVAAVLPGDPESTASDLLSQLKSHATSVHDSDKQQDSEKPTPSLGDLFSGMKIEPSDGGRKQQDRPRFSDRSDRSQTSRRSFSHHDIPSGGLFSAEPLGIFTKKTEIAERNSTSTEVTLWDMVEKEELGRLIRTPPTNGFEEMIQWTREGKLWHFPINNEQGMDEEAKYEFSDHVFFDDLLEDFPKKGPIRHFMELVTTGLSKNPYMTVPQKKEHITWYKNYFEEKKQILDDVIKSSQEQ